MKQKYLWLSIGVFTLIIVASRYAVHSQDTLPIPLQKVPSPNGWDFVVLAIKSMHDGPGGLPASIEAKDNPARDLALQRAYVSENTEAFRLLHEAFLHPAQRPFDSQLTGDFYKDSGKNFDSGHWLRRFSDLITQKSRVELADGKLSEAANSAVDIMQLGIISMRGGGEIESTVGYALEDRGRGELRAFASRLDATTLQSVAQRLEKIESLRPTYLEVLEREKWRSLFDIQASFQDPNWKKFRASKTYNKEIDVYAYMWSPEEYARMQKISDRQIQLNYVNEMDRRIKAAQGPLSQQPGPQSHPSDLVSDLKLLFNGLRSDRYLFLKGAAESRLFMTQMALQAYQMQTGRYPDSLQVLVPQILQRVPFDPFASDKPFNYRSLKNSYLLYSIGGDEKDDGGIKLEEVDNSKTTTAAESFHLWSLAKGDILAEALQ